MEENGKIENDTQTNHKDKGAYTIGNLMLMIWRSILQHQHKIETYQNEERESAHTYEHAKKRERKNNEYNQVNPKRWVSMEGSTLCTKMKIEFDLNGIACKRLYLLQDYVVGWWEWETSFECFYCRVDSLRLIIFIRMLWIFTYVNNLIKHSR